MKKLSQWAKENNVNYATAYNWYKTGKLPVTAQKNKHGGIEVIEATKNKKEKEFKPALLSLNASESTTSRRNRAATINRTDAYINIENGLIPFNYSEYGSTSNSALSIQDAIVLCQKCYYNFSAFRNIIDLMSEFAISEIYFRGGNVKSRDFIKALFKKAGLWDLQDQFYREYFRSGNVFIHRIDSVLTKSDANKITQIYGESSEYPEGEILLPLKYVILNPADIQSNAGVSYVDSTYAKVLNVYEVKRLRNPITDEDREFFESLPEDAKNKIKRGDSFITLPLDENKVTAIFYKKQDYEPMSVPLGYPVLKDINWKEELKNIDMAIARTVQQVVLLITVGFEGKDGTIHVSQKLIDSIRELFENESSGRVFVSDFSTKAQFVIPQIAEILDPKKYEVVNEDIRLGLNNILVGDDKFANQHIKVQVFIERLNYARMAFVNQFLIPEIKRISKIMGFKDFPMPYYRGFSLDDKIQWAKIYTRLAELGLLTQEELVDAVEKSKLPSKDESEESQNNYKELRDKGLYQPLIGGGLKEAGRPDGTTGIKQSTKNVSPIGASEKKVSLSKLKEIAVASCELQNKIEEKLKKKHNLKKLNKNQLEVVESLAEIIILNENPENWNENIIDNYLNEPIDKNNECSQKIKQISASKGLSIYSAALLYYSEKE